MSVTLIAPTTETVSRIPLPLFADRIPAGFPSPAQDYVEARLDLNELCIKHPAASYFVRVDGDSMAPLLLPNDILVVDRSLTPGHGDIVIASINAELTVKTLELRPRPRLVPQNPRYAPITPRDGEELEVFGVVTNVVRTLR